MSLLTIAISSKLEYLDAMTMEQEIFNSERSHTGVRLEASWYKRLGPEFEKPYMQSLRKFLQNEKKSGKIIFPKGTEIFRALDLTPFDSVKVVILGQDPYHGPDQAHGLCFSVNKGVPKPPSLQNIFKELKADLNIEPRVDGDLSGWAKQGVLLLNSTLTVEMGLAGSHQKKGWEIFTDHVVQSLNESQHPIVFVLWGAYAQQKGMLITNPKHMFIKSPHPSPLSSHRGFFGSKPFSKVNSFLEKNRMKPIDWSR